MPDKLHGLTVKMKGYVDWVVRLKVIPCSPNKYPHPVGNRSTGAHTGFCKFHCEVKLSRGEFSTGFSYFLRG